MSNADSNKIVQLDCGNCAACAKRALLYEELCRKCHAEYKDWGPGGWKPAYGAILRKCKTNKAFAMIMYTRLVSQLARKKFSDSFGPFPISSKVSDLNT